MYSNPPLQRTILLTTPTSPLLPTIVRPRRAKRAEDGRGEGEGEETKQKDAVNPIYWWLVQVGNIIPSWAGGWIFGYSSLLGAFEEM